MDDIFIYATPYYTSLKAPLVKSIDLYNLWEVDNTFDKLLVDVIFVTRNASIRDFVENGNKRCETLHNSEVEEMHRAYIYSKFQLNQSQITTILERIADGKTRFGLRDEIVKPYLPVRIKPVVLFNSDENIALSETLKIYHNINLFVFAFMDQKFHFLDVSNFPNEISYNIPAIRFRTIQDRNNDNFTIYGKGFLNNLSSNEITIFETNPGKGYSQTVYNLGPINCKMNIFEPKSGGNFVAIIDFPEGIYWLVSKKNRLYNPNVDAIMEFRGYSEITQLLKTNNSLFNQLGVFYSLGFYNVQITEHVMYAIDKDLLLFIGVIDLDILRENKFHIN